jgi:hypothetical protein
MNKIFKSVFILGILSICAFVFVNASPVANFGKSESTDYAGLICAQLTKADGSVQNLGCNHNAITNLGKNFTRDAVSGLGVAPLNGVKYLELSTDGGAPAATDTACPTPVTTGNLAIAVGTVAVIAPSGNYSVTKTWTANAAVNGITKVCLGNDTATPSTNSLFASGLLGQTVNMGSGDQLTINYYPSFG